MSGDGKPKDDKVRRFEDAVHALRGTHCSITTASSRRLPTAPASTCRKSIRRVTEVPATLVFEGVGCLTVRGRLRSSRRHTTKTYTGFPRTAT
jgi:hypothetical protein